MSARLKKITSGPTETNDTNENAGKQSKASNKWSVSANKEILDKACKEYDLEGECAKHLVNVRAGWAE